MIGNINKGGSPYATIKYAAFKDGATILDSNMAGQSPAQLAHEFEYFSNKNSRTQRPVFHLSINPHPNDRPLTEWEYIDIAADIRSELGFDDNKHQYLLSLHTDALLKDSDKIRPHLHLIVNRVDFYGKCKNDYLDYINIQKACRKVEEKYGLITQPHSWEIEEKKGPPSRESEIKFIQDAIKQAAIDKPEMPTFISRLQAQNIDVKCRITRTGKLQGISYGYNDKIFKGRQIGTDYSHQGIQSKLGVLHLQSHKQQIELLTNTPKSDSNSDSSNESITDNSQAVTLQNSDDSIIPSIAEIFRTNKKSETKKELVINNATSKNNSPHNAESIDDNSQSTPPPENNYISIIPSIEEIFGTSKKDKGKGKEEIKDIAPPHVIETQPTIVPSPQSTPDAIVQTTKQSILNDEAVQYAIIIAGYMAKKDVIELKGETFNATLIDNCEKLIVQRRGSNETILEGKYSPSYGGWVITTAIELTPKERERILQLKQPITQHKQQNEGVAKQADEEMEQ